MKKFISIFLVIIMLSTLLPVSGSAMVDCTVTYNIIDITDKVVYERKGLGSAKVTNLKVENADVESATEEDTTLNIVLSGNTAFDATVSLEFGTALDKNMSMSGHTATVTLSDGMASVNMTLKGQYSSLSSLSGTVTYTLNFSLGKVSTLPPERLIESDSKSVYSGVSLDLNLKEYFSDAKEYYLIENDEYIPVEGRIYTFKSFTKGTHTLIFAASNDNGFCSDFVSVFIDVTEIESGAWLGIETSNGSVNFVTFTDSDGNYIDGLTAYLEDKSIIVNLPRTFDVNGKIVAKFDITQNNGLPKLSTSNAFNGSNDTKVYNTTLKSGVGKVTTYLYNAHPKATSNVYTTYTINYATENQIPVLSDSNQSSQVAEIVANDIYNIDLLPLFKDYDGDELTYFVKVNDETIYLSDGNYSFSTSLGGTYLLEFFASDFISTSKQSYIVTLNVKNSDYTYDCFVVLPDDITPKFYITNGYDKNNMDITGNELTSSKGECIDGYIIYTVNVPSNVCSISVRDDVYGGMSLSVFDGCSIKLCKLTANIIDFGNKEIPGVVDVFYDVYKAYGVDGKFLVVPDMQYTFSASPQNTTSFNKATQNIAVEQDTNVVSIKVSYKNPKTIITTTGAVAKLFKFENNYWIHKAIEPLTTVDNGDGTSTHYFTADGNISYRVSMDKKITKAGYLLSSNSANVVYRDDDPLPTDRIDYRMSGSDAATVADDSLLLNINQQNHLLLSMGDTKVVKAYRAWEIINNYLNNIIQPDFNYNIICGDDVVSITPYENQPMTNSSGNWFNVTAIGQGTAIIEVTYDAVLINGGSYGGFYGATDSSRTGLFVVTVGESDANVDFGIKCKTSEGSIVYNNANSKPWDAELDTVYFFGDTGEIKLNPICKNGSINEVAVSCDKGKNYAILEDVDGEYTASIVPGNNIIRISCDNGVAYQIVRGDKIELAVKNATNPGKAVTKGDKVILTLNGVHTPVPKISGTYNPGYSENSEGNSKVHLRYSYDDRDITSEGKQYDFSLNGTTIEFTVPSDSEQTEFKLTDGYIGVGVIGVLGFSDDINSHRNIPDSGSGTRDNKTTFTTRSILPDITVSLGMLPSGNTAPFVRETAPKTATVNLGNTYAISMAKVFSDREGDKLTYQAKIDDGEKAEVDEYYTFTPDATGTYTIEFTAFDNECESECHILTLTVKEKSNSSSSSSTEFDISSDDIAGYVNISFSDNGKRVEGEKNIKYPKAIGTIISSKRVPYKKGDTVADVTIRLLDALDYTYEHTGTTSNGFYLSSIGGFTAKGIYYDSFGEFDAGAGSGWMITLNKKFIEYGASDFEVENGDVIKWQYTCQLGQDIGDPFYQGSSSNKNKTKKEQQIEKTTEKPIMTEGTFVDVKKDDWYYDGVKYVYENDIMNGTETGFEPNSNMTRAMLVTALYRMSGADNVSQDITYSDVSTDMWYYDAVKWATANNIVNGVGNNKFAPEEYVTREQLAVILYRYAKEPDADTFLTIDKFDDANIVSEWAFDAVKWAYGSKILNGTSETKISPYETATRAQVATMVMRYANMLKEN